jgi:hypothetical protein
MDHLVRRLGMLPVGGIAVSVIVALTVWRTNMNRLGYEHALPTIGTVVAFAAFGTVALRYILGSWARAGIATSLLAVLTFYSVPFAQVLAPAQLVPLVVLAMAAVSVAAARKIPANDAAVPINGKLNLLLIPVSLFLLVSVAIQQVQVERARPEVDRQFHSFQGRAPVNAPDVWHILFDRYASEDVLASRYGFDNRPLLSALRNRGFVVGDNNFSNYQRTAHSLAATMNGASLDALTNAVDGSQNDWVPIYRAISDNQATKFFDGNGYETVFAGTWWSPTRRLAARTTINHRAIPELARQLLDQSIVGLALRLTALPYGDSRGEQCERENKKFDELEQLARTPGRNYVFAHFLVPHPPFVFNADGGCRSLAQARNSTRRDNYIAQVQFANDRMIRLIDAILAGPGEEVIVVHSDEGPWPDPFVGDEHAIGRDPVSVDWRNVDAPRLREKMGILMAMRAPGGPTRSMPKSPVQIYPAILKDHFGSEAPLPADSHEVFESDVELYRFHNVGSKLAGR